MAQNQSSPQQSQPQAPAAAPPVTEQHVREALKAHLTGQPAAGVPGWLNNLPWDQIIALILQIIHTAHQAHGAGGTP